MNYAVNATSTKRLRTDWKTPFDCCEQNNAGRSKSMNKRHKATCNSGLAKYPDGVPVGICADRNCDCGVEASSEIAGKSMNKSEIAERFEKLAEFYDGESMRNCVHRGEEIAKMLRQVLGERAIAESQAPQSELNQRESTTRLSNEMNALGGIWANLGTTWIPVEEKLPSEGEMVLTFHADSEIWNVEKYPHSVARGFHPDEPTMWFDAPVSHWMPLPSPPNVSQERYQCRGCGEEYAVGVKCDLCELGDGEPSPPPDWPKKVAEQLVRLVESWQTISEEDAPEIEAVIRSGAAQEVSLSASEIRSDDPPPSCHVCGEIMVKWKCLKCGATTGCSDEEVSPPSPSAEEFWPIWQESKEGQDAYTKYWPDEIGAIATRFAEAYTQAEGDTRELKAALRHAICDHVHTSGGNDYVLCRDCELEWDYRRTTAKLAVKAEAEKLLG
jgi:hypothetical protein